MNHSISLFGVKWQPLYIAGFKLSFLREESSLKLEKYTRLTRVFPEVTEAGNSCWGGVAACKLYGGTSVTPF